jgi:hypothetical protein
VIANKLIDPHGARTPDIGRPFYRAITSLDALP